MAKRMISVTEQGVLASIPMVFGGGSRISLTADFSYRPDDPYGVTVVFRTTEQAVTWQFGRDLLAEGIHEPAGVGDVQAWPKLNPRGVAMMVIELDSPDGVVQVEGAIRDIARFLDAAYRLVPAGAESGYLDIDAELADLLAS